MYPTVEIDNVEIVQKKLEKNEAGEELPRYLCRINGSEYWLDLVDIWEITPWSEELEVGEVYNLSVSEDWAYQQGLG